MSLINFNENPFMALTSSFLIEKISILMVIAIILHAVKQKISDEINSQAQCILDRINNIEKVVNDLYEEKRRREVVQRTNPNETKSINSSTSSYSSNIQSEGVSYDIWSRFIKIADRIIFEKNLALDEVCNRIAIEISDSGVGKICAQTVNNFYQE
ncbi:hypothetical protein RhiirC2_789383 [Rhizophagus irregularis]|uniref:Uncharacterized protein n=1 Tax=Rhizophagus irregularis TaxID=588596 RepID=A0A2N1MN89_9GLOM|nr:hypothetical protein RhiirC2_789383 [Rhizophagus irregularis]